MNYIITKEENNVLTVSLNRPEVHNAMNPELIAGLTKVFEEAGQDKNIRAIVLKGEGKSFCAGADLNYMKEIAGYGFEENYRDGLRLAALFRTIYECPKPVIALIHGAVFGGANGLVAAADIVLAEEKTVFAFSEVKLGIIPATIAPFVIKKTGEFAAKDLMMTGRRFGVQEAIHYRLINAFLPKEQLEEHLAQIIDQLKTSAPEAVQETKKLIRYIMEHNDMETIIEKTAKWIAERRASAEGQEGMAAFLEKRKPQWY